MDDDIWVSTPFEIFNETERGARTWEHFYNKDFKEAPIYLSEATPETWNAAWIELDSPEQNLEHRQDVKGTNLYRQDAVLSALFELGLGFRSALFLFDGDKACQREKLVPASGLSSPTIINLMKVFGETGQKFRFIKDFVKEISRNITVCPSIAAAAAAIGSLSNSVYKHIIQLEPRPITMLQLQDAFERPRIIVERLSCLAESLKPLKDDTKVVNMAFAFAEKSESVNTWFRPIAVYILHMVAGPILQMLGDFVGLKSSLRPSSQLRKAFDNIIQTDQDPATQSQVLHAILPTFIDTEQKDTIFGISRILGLIETYDKDSVLVRNETRYLSSAPSLELGFTWEDTERIQENAAIYEGSTKNKLNQLENALTQMMASRDLEESHPLSNDAIETEEDSLAEIFARTTSLFNEIPNDSKPRCIDEPLDILVRGALEGASDSPVEAGLPPTFSLAVSSSLSLMLSTQMRLVNHASLMTLLYKYDLLHQFELQYEYQLLGSGLFSSRLSQALFSTHLSSAERRKGHMRSGIMGLRLESRETWPPRDSELRLVLMGILSESYQDSFPRKALHGGGDDLPGDLSFAVRNLTEPEIEACLKQNSLHALDFLRLQYRPSAPLDSIFTQSVLDKYDRVFRFLLRIKRVSFGTTQMAHHHSRLRGNRSTKVNTLIRFRMEACHFVDSLSLYVHTSISSLWTRFFEIVRSLEASLHEKERASLGGTDVLTQLSSLHEIVLDQLLFDLQLRKRQEQVMQLIENILSRILDFTRKIDDYVEDEGEDQALNTSTITDVPSTLDADFTTFREQVSLLIIVCHSLGTTRAYKLDKASAGSKVTQFAKQWTASQREAIGIESLAMMLDMNGFYQKWSTSQTP